LAQGTHIVPGQVAKDGQQYFVGQHLVHHLALAPHLFFLSIVFYFHFAGRKIPGRRSRVKSWHGRGQTRKAELEWLGRLRGERFLDNKEIVEVTHASKREMMESRFSAPMPAEYGPRTQHGRGWSPYTDNGG
jgi:hypothetical protein